MELCDPEPLTDCDPHAVAPIGICKVLLKSINAVVPPPQFVFVCRRARNNPNIVPIEINSGFGQHVPESHIGERHRRRNPQPFKSVDVTTFGIEIGANGHEPV